MRYPLERCERLEWRGFPVYLRADPPFWFVPNRAGDELLRKVGVSSSAFLDPLAKRFFDRLPEDLPGRYQGRLNQLQLQHLREIWFHITNRCNLSCRHCLFSSSPDQQAQLDARFILKVAAQAIALGCRIFVFTGGEPLLHPDFAALVETVLSYPETNVVVLTNGHLLRHFLQMHRPDPARFHLQISLDGLHEIHDVTRGQGSFTKVQKQLKWLREQGYPFTLSMCPTRSNIGDMADLVDLAGDVGASNIHFMWYFVRGRGAEAEFVPPHELLPHLLEAAFRAEQIGMPIDNLEALKTQVFAPPGTIHDGGVAGWESVAVGPDGRLYPSAALVGIKDLATGLERGLENAWRRSPVLQSIREATAATLESPWRFMHGGGDLDHSYLHGGTFVGSDPYLHLQEQLMLWLINREAEQQPENGPPGIRLKMGDILSSCGAHGAVALTHSNCLLALAQENSLTVVKDFYSDAARNIKEEILNPVCYPPNLMEHIPREYHFRGYGCGSPVTEAGLKPGETVLDLGCGSGMECFIAARLVGPKGRVLGVDMLDPMLDAARRGAEAVAERLGYRNMTFHKAHLEALPLESDSVDVAISNCVLNLSTRKRDAFREIHRVLRPGARLIVSDVVCDRQPDAAILNDETLRGECIAGALTQKDLVAALEAAGFEGVKLIKRFPYRVVRGHPFYSLTFEARKKATTETVPVVYRGPFSCVTMPSGQTLVAGSTAHIPRSDAEWLGDQLFILGSDGTVLNQEEENTCNCGAPPEQGGLSSKQEVLAKTPLAVSGRKVSLKRASGCMVCGAPLHYEHHESERKCSYCEHLFMVTSACEKGHYVCDKCHSEDAIVVIENVALKTTETDMLKLLDTIRRHPAIPVHGPEHHAMVPAIILSTYRNLGGSISDTDVQTALRRGSQVPGGACGFMGCCGAATGVGIAFSIMLRSSPVKGGERHQVQTITQQVLADIAQLEAARCCQRDCWIALKKAAQLSRTLLPIPLRADYLLRCRQQGKNRECMKVDCPIHQSSAVSSADGIPA